MKIAIGSDHAGYKLKEKLILWLRSPAGGRRQVRDMGTHSEESCDYPDFAQAVAHAVANKRVSKGILICGTGIGMSMAANKVHGIRAAVVWNPEVAGLAAEHNDANVICLPARYATPRLAEKIVKTYLSTPFGGGRHLRRVRKMMKLERCG
jgi:ribose 5-phosphate isomerase B